MKKIVSFMLVALTVVAFTSCKKSGDTPESIAEKFLTHLNKKEYVEAKALGTESTGQIVDMMKSLAEMGGSTEEPKEVKIENMKAEVDGDNAVVSYTIDGKDETLNLVKKEGKWLVDMKKEDPTSGTPDEDETQGETAEEVTTEQPAE